MKAVILAGGFGSRLKAIVNTVPKPLAPVADGKCFLDILLEKLIASGFDDYIFCVHYMHERIEARYGDGDRLGIKIEYSIEGTPLGTAGAIGLLRKMISERFYVLNADTYVNLDYTDFTAEHLKKSALISMALARVNDPGRYGRVKLDSHMNVTDFEEKGLLSKQQERSGRYVNAGVYLFEPEVFQFIPKHKSSLENEVFPAVLNSGSLISGYCNTSDFLDIGVPEDYMHFIQNYYEKRTDNNKTK